MAHNEEKNEKQEPKSIKLPNSVDIFSNLKNAKRFAIDIGGSLTKIAYYSTVSHRQVLYQHERKQSVTDGTKLELIQSSGSDDELVSVETPASVEPSSVEPSSVELSASNQDYKVYKTARLHFIKFETKYIESCLDFIRGHLTGSKEVVRGKSIKATGGGAYKYADLIHEKLGLTVDKEDEMSCLIKGTNFLLKNISDEAFVFERHGSPEYQFQHADPDIFPYLLVNVGSGVSIMKVTGEEEEEYERIGGTATGGGTFFGLGSLLTSAKSFDELLVLAEKGDHRKIDMLVRDIYGGDYINLGLPGELIASSFGKAASLQSRSNGSKMYAEEDVARSLLFTISNDIGQIACLHAMMHNLNKVYFGGYFLRGHPLSMHTVSYAINYWSRGKVQALFLRHEGYLGSIGAFLKGAEEWDSEKYSWVENYAGSSGLVSSISAEVTSRTEDGQVKAPVMMELGQLEMDLWCSKMAFCPLLAHPQTYTPDTVDLTQDNEARDYWLACFEESAEKMRMRAVLSQPDSPSSQLRGDKFKAKLLARLRYLKLQPFAYGQLTVRSLLDTIEHYLKEFDFPDPYLEQKQKENNAALSLLGGHLKQLDELDALSRQERLVHYVLAGNMFDWGAKEVSRLLEDQSEEFGFQQALNAIPPRPWLVDSLDVWVNRVQKGPPHKCCAIFVDNSGLDVVLGVVPFARELIRNGTQVILCCNSAPALNDVTHTEMKGLLDQISDVCSIIKSAVQCGNLIVMETGQAGPCLDLRCISEALCNEMMSRQVDLVVIEGMGRSVHTNLNATFKCESFKIAVVKNRWLASRLGGDIFSVICSYSPAVNDNA